MMPKPTRDAVLAALTGRTELAPGETWTFPKLDELMALVDAAWAEDEEERERSHRARELFMVYGRHNTGCASYFGSVRACDCGYSDARATLSGPSRKEVLARGVASRGHTSTEAEVGRHNQEQRIKRQGYEAALEECGYNVMGGPKEVAAARYPLRKRVPKVVADSHGAGDWSTNDGKTTVFRRSKGAVWSNRDYDISFSAPRVRALAALLDDPWEIVEDTSVEEGT